MIRFPRNCAALAGAALLFVGCASGPAPEAQSRTLVKGECPDGPLAAIFDRTLPRNGGHDADLIGAAVLSETNRARCREGLAPLDGNAALQQAAGLHSQDMARENFFSHDSPVRGRETLAARVTQVGYRFQRVAENIIESRYMAYRNGAPFQIIDAVRCEFAYADGERIKPHSYATLAREVVTRWMASTGHRENILTPELRAHGFALAPNSDPSLCGGIFATQVMAR